MEAQRELVGIVLFAVFVSSSGSLPLGTRENLHIRNLAIRPASHVTDRYVVAALLFGSRRDKITLIKPEAVRFRCFVWVHFENPIHQ
jgi:hypothetical protein